jgi:hypothetical protein
MDAGGRATHGAVAERPWMATPEIADGFSYIKLFLICFSHPCVLDTGNPCRYDDDMACVDT